MQRPFLRALLVAWDRPEFHEALRHLIDLDEIKGVLAALALGGPDGVAERRFAELAGSALETPEIRDGILFLLDDSSFRQSIAESVAESTPDHPALAGSIHAALDDPVVRVDLRAALESPSLRASLIALMLNLMRQRRMRAAVSAISLLRQRSARRLGWRLQRHGVLRELRRLKPRGESSEKLDRA